jgi:hypothetical protein
MTRTVAIILLLTASFACFTALADEYKVFILCNPKTPVIVRETPRKGAKETGRLDFGDEVWTDGRKRNGYLHVIDITEAGEGWVFAGNTVQDQPEKLTGARANVAATGRVMTYRWVKGKKNGWVEIGTQVIVYAVSEEWAVTNKGYIRTKYLEVWYE